QNPVLRSTVVVVILLDASPDWERFCATVARAGCWSSCAARRCRGRRHGSQCATVDSGRRRSRCPSGRTPGTRTVN
ncbi:hypothetical protein, partial [Gordonia aichiensis]